MKTTSSSSGMGAGMKVFLGIAIVVILLGLFIGGQYNRFVTLDQNVEGSWSEVENQYQRQADLVPNLLSAVSSAVKVETTLIKEVTDARSRWQESTSLFDKDAAGTQMSNGIVALVNAVATAENYPTLQANKQYVALTDELAGTQNRITVARGRYIEAIRSFNTAVKRFPGNIFAGIFGYSERQYYTAEQSALDTAEIGSGELP